MAQELKRDVTFEIKLSYSFHSVTEMNVIDEDNAKYKIKIKVHNKEEQEIYFWDLDKFENRFRIIKEDLL